MAGRAASVQIWMGHGRAPSVLSMEVCSPAPAPAAAADQPSQDQQPLAWPPKGTHCCFSALKRTPLPMRWPHLEHQVLKGCREGSEAGRGAAVARCDPQANHLSVQPLLPGHCYVSQP